MAGRRLHSGLIATPRFQIVPARFKIGLFGLLHDLFEELPRTQDQKENGQHEGDHPEEGEIVAW